MNKRVLMSAAILFAGIAAVCFGITTNAASVKAVQTPRIYIRTENYPRPPYSGATYYIYERDDEIICTKLEVCNKYDQCSTTYKKGAYKTDEDIETGEPYGKTDRVVIPASKLRKHKCLTKFKLVP